MRKPACCKFYGLCFLISFSLLTITVRGVSNKHCLLPFFSFLAHLSRRLIGELIVYKGIRRPSVNIFKRHLL